MPNVFIYVYLPQIFNEYQTCTFGTGVIRGSKRELSRQDASFCEIYMQEGIHIMEISNYISFDVKK